MRRYFFIICLLSLDDSARAKDGVTLDLSVVFLSTGSKVNTTNSEFFEQKEQFTFYSLKSCYVYKTFCLGLKYLSGDRDGESQYSESEQKIQTKRSYSGFALTAGYSGDHLIAHYNHYLNMNRDVRTQTAFQGQNSGFSDVISYPATSAYSLDLGYGFKVKQMRIGPQFSISHFTYSKRVSSSGETELEVQESEDFVLPFIALWLDF